MRKSKAERTAIAAVALADLSHAYALSRAHSNLAIWAEQKFGKKGPLISGVVREHFPPDVKEHLRFLASGVGESFRWSLARWRMAGRRRETWLRAKADIRNREGSGFYG